MRAITGRYEGIGRCKYDLPAYERQIAFTCSGHQRSQMMRIVETLKSRTKALKVQEIADLLGVTPQHIYKMAASGRIPSFRISGSVRFDPHDVAAWLKEKQAPPVGVRRIVSASVAA